ncbi:aminoacyl--tRNA ligase-related protein [Kitasatospora kifunensis]|uniref:Seryl-tRNA synthetase n=1 Tax=Kitasatospora kifunensis TaxID=58351 RepID=A0A7W7VYC7_KITKI|nr:aminoacyl--tRNA ligase-related protein [Kitasatospora kifunensis]MBB4927406.1 seryl-tRNA synthetase [Kitasatospora kifunensis]
MGSDAPSVVIGQGLAALGPEATQLLHLLDETFRGWGDRRGAHPLTMPPLLPVADLAKLDFYENFPQLAVVAATLDVSEGADHSAEARTGAYASASLNPAALALPSAACYGVFLNHAGTEVPDGRTVTVLGRCYRNEDRYEGLRRLLGFHMREIVALGSYEHTQRHLGEYGALVQDFAEAVGLPVEKQVATDPFYDSSGSRAVLQQLAPVKHEFVYAETAISSINVHRNFFGERCDIRLEETGEAVFTSCVAFGLERWIFALENRYSGDWDKAFAAVEGAAAAVS